MEVVRIKSNRKKIIKNKQKRKEGKKIIALSFSILLLVILGVSYAWLRTTIEGEKNVQLVVGDISLVLDESTSNGIQLTNQIPVYDEEGQTYEPYKFSLVNESSIALYYTLSLIDDEEILSNCVTTSGKKCELLDLRDVRYELKVGNRKFLGSLSDSSIISYGTIDSNETIDCELRIWLNINATNETMGKVYSGKLKVFATQQVDDFNFEQGNDAVNAPEMDANMIAVRHDGYNWVKTDTDNSWYNYDMGIWANAVTVKNDKLANYQTAPIGTEISMDDIETMWVWIPRYSYTIASTDGDTYYGKKGVYLNNSPTAALPGEIDIKFISKDEKDRGNGKYLATGEPKNWYTPDAFTYDGNELSGIWVGKFETSSSNHNIDYGGSNTTELDPMIKPNVTSWRNITISNIHTVATKISAEGNRYGFSNYMNSHAMKNSEWATVSYLSQSRYGKLGNENYNGENKEIYQNKSNSFITGCSSGEPSNSNANYNCYYKYDNNIRTEDENTGKGVGASTTGTIYGVYDMSGGAWEYVMANYNDFLSVSGFTEMPELKYYDRYTGTGVYDACKGDECLSHGLSETKGWYSDYGNFLYNLNPWMIRGGSYAATDKFAGIFAFDIPWNCGSVSSDTSFRITLSPTN